MSLGNADARRAVPIFISARGRFIDCLGARFDDRAIGKRFFCVSCPERPKSLRVDIDRAELGKN